VLGFPIRKSSDLSSVDSSPRLIAASYVLHRLLVPRHPPYALHYLQQRCSRPLCSSQTTHKPPCQRYHQHPENQADVTTTIARRYFQRQTLACSLRTQQCTDITLFPPALGPAVMKKMLVSVPPMSTTGLHVNPKWLCPHTIPDSSGCVGRCSLERR
jgi:hypothetical protein